MKEFKITYVTDRTLVEHTKTVKAIDVTKAYLNTYIKLPTGSIITDIIEINN